MSIKKCPTKGCQQEYGELANYCRRCGMALVMSDNRCSKQKHALCDGKVFKNNDDYCEYCGSLTLYGLERKR